MTCRCDKPTRDDAYVCDDCGDALAKALGDVTWLDEELEVTITKQRAIPTGGGGGAAADCSCDNADVDSGKCKHGALPWHDAAAEARVHLRALLVSWTLFCDAEGVRNSAPPPPIGPTCRRCVARDPNAHQSCERIERGDMPADTLADMAGWLLWRVDGLTLHELGPDVVEEITLAVAACERLIDRRPDRWYAGPCVETTLLAEECGTDLYARSTRGDVECPACGSTYDVAERRRWLLDAAEDRLANSREIARAVSWLGAEPLTSDRVRKWAERGRLVAKGHDGRSPLYRIGDAIDLLASDTSTKGDVA